MFNRFNPKVLFSKNPIGTADNFSNFSDISPEAERLRRGAVANKVASVIHAVASICAGGLALDLIDKEQKVLPDALNFVYNPIVSGVMCLALGGIAITEHSRANILEHSAALQLVQGASA
jgi:hypothetical protein